LHHLKRITRISGVSGHLGGGGGSSTERFALRHIYHMGIHLEQLWEIEPINVDGFLINIILMCHFFICVILRFL
jgi:hypothetical protein